MLLLITKSLHVIMTAYLGQQRTGGNMKVVSFMMVMVLGWFVIDWAQDKVIEECNKGRSFVVKGHKFECTSADSFLDKLLEPDLEIKKAK